MIDWSAGFRNGAGDTAANPLVIAGPVPGVDLRSVGLLLAPPVLSGEFVPVSFWEGVERLSPQPVTPKPSPLGLHTAFSDAVREMTAQARGIGVMVSGGLDSLAVLLHACAVAEGRRVVAFTIDISDDVGGGAVAEVKRLLDAFDLDVELVVLDPRRDRLEPEWSPVGPRLDGLPEVHAAAAARAEDLGLDIILSGDGSDELLGTPRYATTAIARRHGLRGARQYLRDVAGTGPGLFGETAAVGSRLVSRRLRALGYWAENWPEWCDPVAPSILAEPYRAQATEWSRQWVADEVAAHAAKGWSWAEADAYDALFPYTLPPPAGRVPEESPFLHRSFLEAALAVPLADRYRPGLPSKYWRGKALVLDLLPPGATAKLSPRKQYYSGALAGQAALLDKAQPLLLTEVGLVDRERLAQERDTGTLIYLAGIERWLRGAQRHGATFG
ncbi:asparagine synthase-related protein [Streptomyces sp. NPDC006784]|uniref:asparagine synthase-related protein n=1 Tax=Streptomyces sp. NPDC006784 TaxID=3364764 RepID=UPI0036A078AE